MKGMIVREHKGREWIGFEDSRWIHEGEELPEAWEQHPSVVFRKFSTPFQPDLGEPPYIGMARVKMQQVRCIEGEQIRNRALEVLTQEQYQAASVGGMCWDGEGGLFIIGPMDLPARVCDTLRELSWGASSRFQGHTLPRTTPPGFVERAYANGNRLTIAEQRYAIEDHCAQVARWALRSIIKDKGEWGEPSPSVGLDPKGHALASALDEYLGRPDGQRWGSPVELRFYERVRAQGSNPDWLSLRYMGCWWESEDSADVLTEFLYDEIRAIDPECADKWRDPKSGGACFWRINPDGDAIMLEWLRWVAAALWRSRVGPRLKRSKTLKHSAALASSVVEGVSSMWGAQVQDGRIVDLDGRTIGRVDTKGLDTLAPTVRSRILDTIQNANKPKGAQLAGVHVHRISWTLAKHAFDTYVETGDHQKGAVLTLDGGWKEWAQRISGKSKPGGSLRAAIKGVTVALSRLWIGGDIEGSLLSFWEGKNGLSFLRIAMHPGLQPHYINELKTKAEGNNRRFRGVCLVPLIDPDTYPLTARRPNEQGAQMALATLLVHHIARHSFELRNRGGVEISAAQLQFDATRAKLPSNMLDETWKGFIQGHGDKAPLLEETSPGYFHISQEEPFIQARRFLDGRSEVA